MAIHIQRKRFESREIAEQTRDGFHDPAFHISAVDVQAQVVEDDDGVWVVVTQQGDLVTGDEPLLPDYERVG